MKKYAIVTNDREIILITKSMTKAMSYMLFNTKWDAQKEIGVLPDGRRVHYEVY